VLNKLIFVGWAGLGLAAASAGATEVFARLESSDTRNATSLVDASENRPERQRGDQTSFGFADFEAHPSFQLGASVYLNHVDYGATRVRDARLIEVPIEGRTGFRAEPEAEARLLWESSSRFSASLWGRSYLVDSPSFARSAGLRLSPALAEGRTRFDLELNYRRAEFPEDFFLDRDLRVKVRPRTGDTTRGALAWEQAITRRWKSRVEFTLLDRAPLRPITGGVTLSQAVSLWPRVSARWESRYFRESHAPALRDDRGYMSAAASQVTLSFEPVYDWLLSVSYGLSVEREDDPRPGGDRTQIGADHYGLGMTYAWSRAAVDVGASLVRTNSRMRSALLGGSLRWTL
jgi:hypothetical protein